MLWVEVLVAGTAVTPGIGGRLRRAALRLLAGVGLGVLAWLLSAMVNSGTASAAENSAHPHGGTHSSDSNDSSGGNGLLGGLLGGLGNTLSNVTGTVSTLTTTVTDVTTGLVGDVTTGLGDTLDTVTGVVAPVTNVLAPPSAGQPPADSGDTTQTSPVRTKPTDPHAVPATIAVAPVVAVVVPPADPDMPTRTTTTSQSTSVAVQQVWAPTRHVLVLPSQPLPDQPAPQPAPDPAVPVSFASPGHGFHGPARHALGAHPTHLTAPTLAAHGAGSPDSAALAAQHQGLPPTTPD